MTPFARQTFLEKNKITIHPDAIAACITVRHSLSVPTGDNRNRTITMTGMILCHEVSSFYSELCEVIRESLHIPADRQYYSCSNFPRSEATLWEIAHPEHIQRSALLTYEAGTAAIDSGKWNEERAGLSDLEKLQDLICEPNEIQDPFRKDGAKIRGFVKDTDDQSLDFAVGHEYGLSYGAGPYLQNSKIGLNECEGFLYLLNQGKILSVDKLVPYKVAQRGSRW